VRVLLYTRVLFVFGAEAVVTYAELAGAVEGTQYVSLSAFLYARVHIYIWGQWSSCKCCCTSKGAQYICV